jgi:hypothetical protein
MGENRLLFRIGPTPCREREWREDDASAIIENPLPRGQAVDDMTCGDMRPCDFRRRGG